MEEKDISGIAGAVAIELAKLNKEDKRADVSDESNKKGAELFKCPDCGGEVAGGIMYCQHCGCELEWEA